MMNLSFSLPDVDSAWRGTWKVAQQKNPSELTEIDLRYKYFSANVEMIVDGVEVISSRSFVTLVDLALSLLDAERCISSGEDTAVGFTERAEVIHLRHSEGNIVVTSSEQSWRVVVDREELRSSISEFLREVHSCLTSEVPGLSSHPTIRQMQQI
ncbi:hypothetical protein ACFWAF_19905 [Streptomyces microflavus]|uniref:hypothetical protein n=1 Tax=Streptomyces microflavus TaxID=1919 RepID=UPI00364A9F6D